MTPNIEKHVTFFEKVEHRQTFGQIARHGRYSVRYKTNKKLPLVDESNHVPIGKKSVAVDVLLRQNRNITERALTRRDASCIRKTSPSWKTIPAAQNEFKEEHFTIEELKELYVDVFLDILYKGTKEHPGTPQNLKDRVTFTSKKLDVLRLCLGASELSLQTETQRYQIRYRPNDAPLTFSN